MSAGALSQKPGTAGADVKPTAQDTPALAKSRDLAESVGPARFNAVKRERAQAGSHIKTAIEREAIHRKEKPGKEKPGKDKDKDKGTHGAQPHAAANPMAATADKGAPGAKPAAVVAATPPPPMGGKPGAGPQAGPPAQPPTSG